VSCAPTVSVSSPGGHAARSIGATPTTVRIDLLVSSNKITIAQASPGANPGDPGVARCAAQAMRDAQFDGWAPGSGIYKEAPITWR
jgi:hypothetical protein